MTKKEIAKAEIKSFQDKIDKIIETNPYTIGTVSALEKSVGLGTSTLSRAYTKNREPSITVVKKILQSLHIPLSWWDNPIGNPFKDPFEAYKELSERIEKLEFQREQAQKENTLIRLENQMLRERIERLELKM